MGVPGQMATPRSTTGIPGHTLFFCDVLFHFMTGSKTNSGNKVQRCG